MNESAQARANAALALTQIVQYHQTIDRLEHGDQPLLTSPLVSELVYGTCRFYYSLTATIDRLLEKPLRSKDLDVYHLLLVGAYQLQKTRIKEHAVLNETVNACRLVKRTWAKGLVNAVLRKVSRDNTEQSFDLPEWLALLLQDLVQQDQRDALLRDSSTTRAPMCLRVNAMKTTRDDYQSLLTDADIDYQPLTHSTAVCLTEPMPTERLPGWAEGMVAVQDYGAQLVGCLAGQIIRQDHPEGSLLDACAAPGGKLFHLLEQQVLTSNKPPVALELSEPRARATEALAARLGHAQHLTLGDGTQLDWWDKQPFDFILLDAPCSGTGTLRRHPDIKLLIQPQDIATHASLQQQLLRNLWSTLATQGTLLYCTCSLLAAENDEVIEAFLSSLPADAAGVQSVTDYLQLGTGQATRYGWQLLPTDPNTDGFYMAVIKKKAGSTTP